MRKMSLKVVELPNISSRGVSPLKAILNSRAAKQLTRNLSLKNPDSLTARLRGNKEAQREFWCRGVSPGENIARDIIFTGAAERDQNHCSCTAMINYQSSQHLRSVILNESQIVGRAAVARCSARQVPALTRLPHGTGRATINLIPWRTERFYRIPVPVYLVHIS